MQQSLPSIRTKVEQSHKEVEDGGDGGAPVGVAQRDIAVNITKSSKIFDVGEVQKNVNLIDLV